MVARAREQGQGPVTAAEGDVAAIKRLAQFLAAEAVGRARLVASDGQSLEVPEAIYALLRQALPVLAHGDAVAVVPLHKELTTHEAAGLLQVSRPFLIKLLEEGAIPYTRVGAHRRMRLQDVLAYKQRRHEEAKKLLDEIAALSQEYGLYD